MLFVLSFSFSVVSQNKIEVFMKSNEAYTNLYPNEATLVVFKNNIRNRELLITSDKELLKPVEKMENEYHVYLHKISQKITIEAENYNRTFKLKIKARSLKKHSVLVYEVGIKGESLTMSESPSFTDARDGKVYRTINVGNQTWMADNLNYVTTEGSWCYNDNNVECSQNGRLYKWITALNACPEGWRLPTKDDYEKLIRNLEQNELNAHQALMPGGSTGFNAFYGGWRQKDGTYENIRDIGCYWASTPVDEKEAWNLYLSARFETAYLYYAYNREMGFSVRCIKE